VTTGSPAKNHRKGDRVRDFHAARLRAEGSSYQQIADEMGYSSSGAFDAVQRGLQRSVREPTDAARDLQLNALDELAREAWAVLRREHFVVDRGQVVWHDGAPLRDDMPVLRAIDALLKVHERQSKLLGLNAPPKVQVDSTRVQMVVAQIRQVLEGAVQPVPLELVSNLDQET
jgi:hypothetical protein